MLPLGVRSQGTGKTLARQVEGHVRPGRRTDASPSVSDSVRLFRAGKVREYISREPSFPKPRGTTGVRGPLDPPGASDEEVDGTAVGRTDEVRGPCTLRQRQG